MVKIVLEIEEKSKQSFKDLTALCVDVNIIEIAKNVTKAEIESSRLLKNRLGVENKTQIVNNCRNEQNKELVEILQSIIG